jgi:hypothetical protein
MTSNERAPAGPPSGWEVTSLRQAPRDAALIDIAHELLVRHHQQPLGRYASQLVRFVLQIYAVACLVAGQSLSGRANNRSYVKPRRERYRRAEEPRRIGPLGDWGMATALKP